MGWNIKIGEKGAALTWKRSEDCHGMSKGLKSFQSAKWLSMNAPVFLLFSSLPRTFSGRCFYLSVHFIIEPFQVCLYHYKYCVLKFLRVCAIFLGTSSLFILRDIPFLFIFTWYSYFGMFCHSTNNLHIPKSIMNFRMF